MLRLVLVSNMSVSLYDIENHSLILDWVEQELFLTYLVDGLVKTWNSMNRDHQINDVDSVATFHRTWEKVRTTILRVCIVAIIGIMCTVCIWWFWLTPFRCWLL